MVDKVTNIDEWEAEFRSHLGAEAELVSGFEVAKDSIVVCCDAIADNNPLWINEAYAKKSRFGMITAPPAFLIKVNDAGHSVLAIAVAVPAENVSQMYSGAEMNLFRPIRVGDKLTAIGRPASIIRKETKTRGAILFATSEVTYYNQSKEKVGTLTGTVAIVPITRSSRDEAPIRVHDPDTPEWAQRRAKNSETLNPDTLAFERKRRGAKPRYWEDVKDGQEMEPMEMGILTATEITRFALNILGIPRVLVRPQGGAPIVGLARAETSQLAHGVADPEDFGPQRTSWFSEFVTNWMGDDGTLKKFSCQIRGPDMMGDINVLKGKVTKKYIAGGEHLVDCEMFCRNQGDVVSAPGWATVALPSRG